VIWLTWRQHRNEALVIGGALVLLAVGVFITGHSMMNDYQQLGVADCVAHPNHLNCDAIVNTFQSKYEPLVGWFEWLNFLPGLLGMLIGAPLVAHELEHGTQRLAWTQSVTRVRWLVVKLALLVIGTLVAEGVITALLTWWFGPWENMLGKLDPAVYDFEGIVPFAYALFALALGIAAGAVLRKTIPAMVVAILGFLAVRLSLENNVRPYFQPPLTTTWLPNGAGTQPGRLDWVVYNGFADSAGHEMQPYTVFNTCRIAEGTGKGQFVQCLQTHGWRLFAQYQPLSRYWTFQAIEAGIFCALIIALLALAIWWVRYRLS
jgi:ABC-2 family transporter protein